MKPSLTGVSRPTTIPNISGRNDRPNDLIIVGTEAEIFYAVQVPLP